MDIEEQQRTYSGFMKWTVRGILASVALLVFLAFLA